MNSSKIERDAFESMLLGVRGVGINRNYCECDLSPLSCRVYKYNESIECNYIRIRQTTCAHDITINYISN